MKQRQNGCSSATLSSAAVAEPATTSSFQQRQCCFHQLDFKSHHQQPTTAAPLNKLPLRAAEILFLASCHREQHKQRPTSYLQPRVTSSRGSLCQQKVDTGRERTTQGKTNKTGNQRKNGEEVASINSSPANQKNQRKNRGKEVASVSHYPIIRLLL